MTCLLLSLGLFDTFEVVLTEPSKVSMMFLFTSVNLVAVSTKLKLSILNLCMFNIQRCRIIPDLFGNAVCSNESDLQESKARLLNNSIFQRG